MAAALLQALLIDIESDNIPRNYFRSRFSAFDLPESTFKKLFRLDKPSVVSLCEKLKRFVEPSRLPFNLKVLVALRFFATGSYQASVANDIYISLSQQSVSNCIRAISKHLIREYIRLPRNEELAAIKEKFYALSRLPGVIGATDCTHISIVAPPTSDASAPSYINSKGFNSMNVQLIDDPDLRILAINAKFPGSVHDSFIWRNIIARHYISQIRKWWLLGDSGYPLEPWLMTPFHNPPPGSIEENFNFKHSSGCSCVERCNGVLKTRFRCLLKDRVLHYSPETAGHMQNIHLEENVHDFGDDENLPLTIGDGTANSSSRARNIRYRLALSVAE